MAQKQRELGVAERSIGVVRAQPPAAPAAEMRAGGPRRVLTRVAHSGQIDHVVLHVVLGCFKKWKKTSLYQVTRERCFSKLKILKTRLRSRMSDEYLNDAMIIAVERETSDNLDPEHILDKYAKSSGPGGPGGRVDAVVLLLRLTAGCAERMAVRGALPVRLKCRRHGLCQQH
ncbi:Zinc finger MYM-type protein 1 [Frankliniella fusca]|uniref:Zinc finger MYM-type protein 1 n=1 Tax=Frankliniella fusca TaxID=407009 RepID=A0AAE1H6U4_9NEOP|nr:Zinc finger MYM-type protein 1 [Frankliniella fusca]